MNAPSFILRDAMQAFVSGYTDKAVAVKIGAFREKLGQVFPAAAPIDREMLRRMLRAVGFVASVDPHDPPGIWRRAVHPGEVPF